MTRRTHSPVLCGVFFLSGAAALIFETLWFRRASLAFGNSVWAGSLVLSSFMAGLALGNGLAARFGRRARRPERWYAVIEVLVAITGILLVWGFPYLNELLAPVFRPLLQNPLPLNSLRLGIAFCLLCIPATAMGMTLPLLVKALRRGSTTFGDALGKLYGWNTLGAVAGALLGETVLIEAFGMAGTSLWAGAFNVVAALGALAVASGPAEVLEAAPVAVQRPPLSPRAKRHLAAAFLAGGVLLALEVVWFRFLQLFFQGTTLTFALMLGVVLGGIGLGGLVASLWFKASPKAYRHAPALALLSGVASLVAYEVFGLGLGDRTSTTVTGYGLEDIGLLFLLMFPVSLLSGILFSLVGAAAHEEVGDEMRTAGLVTMANTVGATLGPILAGFLLIPHLGMELSFLLLGLCYLPIALLLGDASFLRAPARHLGQSVLALGFLAAAVFFPHGHMQRYLGIAAGGYLDEGSEIVAVEEGLTETIQYLRKDFLGETHDYRLVTNGFSMSGTHWGAKRYMKYYVYWPVAVSPDPKTACLISFGCGSTTKALTDTPSLESIDVVDISQEILDLADVVYTPEENPLNDPRVEVFIEDGRYFLQATDKTFDIITGDPPPPKQAGVVNLCTQEYFELMRDRLNDGGVATYWLPTMQFEEEELKATLKGFLNAFGDEASLWGAIGLTWIMIGTKNAEPVTREAFAAQWEDPEIGAELDALGFEHPGQLGATFLMDADDLREYTADVEPLVDNWPKRLSARLGTGATGGNIARYLDVMNTEKARERFRTSPYIRHIWPESLIQESLPYFATQRMLNQLTVPSANPSELKFGQLHYHLTETELETAVLWLFESNPTLQDIIARVGDTSDKKKIVAFHRAVRAISERRYLDAEALLAESQRKRGDRRTVFTRAYLLCMAGEVDRARAFVGENPETFGTPGGRSFLEWLTKTVGYSS